MSSLMTAASASSVKVKTTAGRYHGSPAVTDYEEFADRGHSLPIDAGWREVADATLAWLKHRAD